MQVCVLRLSLISSLTFTALSCLRKGAANRSTHWVRVGSTTFYPTVHRETNIHISTNTQDQLNVFLRETPSSIKYTNFIAKEQELNQQTVFDSLDSTTISV